MRQVRTLLVPLIGAVSLLFAGICTCPHAKATSGPHAGHDCCTDTDRSASSDGGERSGDPRATGCLHCGQTELSAAQTLKAPPCPADRLPLIAPAQIALEAAARRPLESEGAARRFGSPPSAALRHKCVLQL